MIYPTVITRGDKNGGRGRETTMHSNGAKVRDRRSYGCEKGEHGIHPQRGQYRLAIPRCVLY